MTKLNKCKTQEELDDDYDYYYKHFCQECGKERFDCECVDEWDELDDISRRM